MKKSVGSAQATAWKDNYSKRYFLRNWLHSHIGIWIGIYHIAAVASITVLFMFYYLRGKKSGISYSQNGNK